MLKYKINDKVNSQNKKLIKWGRKLKKKKFSLGSISETCGECSTSEKHTSETAPHMLQWLSSKLKKVASLVRSHKKGEVCTLPRDAFITRSQQPYSHSQDTEQPCEQIKKVHIHTQRTTDRQGIIQSGISQTSKCKYCIISLKCGTLSRTVATGDFDRLVGSARWRKLRRSW